MPLYRGLDKPYRPAEVRARIQKTHQGTDFTDCPYTALLYARGSRGVLLVADVPTDAAILVTEELWLDAAAKRFMIWGPFDEYIAAVVPAKELRAQVSRKRSLSNADKATILKHVIERRLAANTAHADLILPRGGLQITVSGEAYAGLPKGHGRSTASTWAPRGSSVTRVGRAGRGSRTRGRRRCGHQAVGGERHIPCAAAGSVRGLQ